MSAELQKRTDTLGRAKAGSQLQKQIYVARRQKELSSAVLDSLKQIGKRFISIEWVAPLEVNKFYEPRDGAFLTTVGLGHLRERLADFWPTRGPRWDALGVLQPGHAILLVEAKSYPAELLGGGCKAGETTRSVIQRSLNLVKKSLNVEDTVDWLGPLYQYANRIAHMHFLSIECGQSAFLANICFLNDPHRPTSRAAWQTKLQLLKSDLGFSTPIPNTIDVFLEARSRTELVAPK